MGAHAVRLSNVDIDTALKNGDFEVLFQPIFDLGNGALARMESFVRWRHPTLGLLPPGAFISFFETQGRMSELTRYVFSQALDAYEGWRGPYPPGFSINLALSDLSDEAFANHFQLVTRERGFPPEFITLECPMPPVDMDAATAAKCFERLGDTGARLAIEVRGRANDFLRTADPFPFAEIKTGGAAILRFARTVRGPGLSAISELLEMARTHNATISAVGVEDQVSLAALRSLGFAAAQGNHLGKVGALSRFTPSRVNVVRKLIGLPALSKEALADLFRTGDPLNRPSVADAAPEEADEISSEESAAPTPHAQAQIIAETVRLDPSDKTPDECDQQSAPAASTKEDASTTGSETDDDNAAAEDALIQRLSDRIAREMDDEDTPRRRKIRVRRKASSRPMPVSVEAEEADAAIASPTTSQNAPTRGLGAGVLHEAGHDAPETIGGKSDDDANGDPNRAEDRDGLAVAQKTASPEALRERLRQELNAVTPEAESRATASQDDASADETAKPASATSLSHPSSSPQPSLVERVMAAEATAVAQAAQPAPLDEEAQEEPTNEDAAEALEREADALTPAPDPDAGIVDGHAALDDSASEHASTDSVDAVSQNHIAAAPADPLAAAALDTQAAEALSPSDPFETDTAGAMAAAGFAAQSMPVKNASAYFAPGIRVLMPTHEASEAERDRPAAPIVSDQLDMASAADPAAALHEAAAGGDPYAGDFWSRAGAPAEEDADIGTYAPTASLSGDDVDVGREHDAGGLVDFDGETTPNEIEDDTADDTADAGSAFEDDISDSVREAAALAKRLRPRKKKKQNFLTRRYRLPAHYRMSGYFWPRSWRRAWKRRRSEQDIERENARQDAA